MVSPSSAVTSTLTTLEPHGQLDGSVLVSFLAQLHRITGPVVGGGRRHRSLLNVVGDAHFVAGGVRVEG